MKKFFKKTEGFTLVELIVVIAILGILAGVGTVGYSGYIKKANLAADQQLLAALNQAFAAACIENGEDSTKVAASGITIGDDKKIEKADIKVTNPATKATAIQDAFDKYYEEGTFKVMNRLYFENGMFWNNDPNNLSPGQQAALNLFKASNMSGNEEDLANSANNLSNLFVTEFLDGQSDPLNSMSSYIGTDFEAFKAAYGLDADSTNTEIANATVLYVASKASTMNATDVMNTINSSTSGNPVMDVMNKYGTLPTAAMMYGVVTGYANSTYASSGFKTAYETKPTGISDVTTLFNQMMSEANGTAYLTDPNNKGVMSDMDGYLGAMQLLSNNEDSIDLSDANAFNNEETLKLLNTILGN